MTYQPHPLTSGGKNDSAVPCLLALPHRPTRWQYIAALFLGLCRGCRQVDRQAEEQAEGQTGYIHTPLLTVYTHVHTYKYQHHIPCIESPKGLLLWHVKVHDEPLATYVVGAWGAWGAWGACGGGATCHGGVVFW